MDGKSNIEHHHVSFRLFIYTFGFSLYLFVFTALYNFIYLENMNYRMWNRSFADAGTILICLSFALSGICYFWNFLDSKIKYRRELGLQGFYMVMTHSILSFFFSSRTKWYEYFGEDQRTAFLFALGSLALFTAMALISNKLAIQKLGGKTWRFILRTGYVAVIFGLIHAVLKAYDDWIEYIDMPRGLPPFSIYVGLAGAATLLLRLYLHISLLKKKPSTNIH